MDPQCLSCPYLCKRLDTQDTPVLYKLDNLSLDQVTLLVHRAIERLSTTYQLKVKKCWPTSKRKVSILLRILYMPDMADYHELLIVEAFRALDGVGTNLCFRFSVPEQCCSINAPRALTALVMEVINHVMDSDALLARNKHPEVVPVKRFYPDRISSFRMTPDAG